MNDSDNFSKLMKLLSDKKLTMDDLETIVLLLMAIKIEFQTMLKKF